MGIHDVRPRPARRRPGFVGGVSGEWYLPAGQTIAGATTAAMTLNTVYYLPIMLVAGTLDRLGVNHFATVGAAGEVGRLGLYSDSGTKRPGSLVVDGGTVALDTATAVKSVTINQAVADDLYWLAWVQQGPSATAQIPVWANAVSGTGGSNPLVNFPGNASTIYGRASVGWQQASVTGALPSTATPAASGLNQLLSIACRYA